MMRKLWLDYGWLAVWSAGLAIALAVRPLMPADETRYVSVAWEMWTRNDFLVPYLNGQTYTHKPPLLFWSIQAGWSVFGVNEWWPRLVSPLAGLGAVFATKFLATKLWPDNPEISRLVPWLLIGGLFWSLFGTATMFDMWIALWAVIAITGITLAVRGSYLKGFVLFTLAIGLGMLTKGPVILLYTLPPALLAPWWLPCGSNIRWRNWYLMILASILGGVIVALFWAVPAALQGGDIYAKAIFWGQTAGRVENSFAHNRPLWWYLPLLPILLFPWLLWPRLWRGKFGIPDRNSWQIRLALSCSLPAFIAFCFISGKQPHYLIPIFPALALIAGARLNSDQLGSEKDAYIPAFILMLVGTVILFVPISFQYFPEIWQGIKTQFWWPEVSLFGGAGILVLAAIMFRWKPEKVLTSTSKMALVAPMTIGLIHLFVFSAAAPAYDLKLVSEKISAYQAEGIPVAWRRKYHNQFHFAGRLTKPILVVKNMPLKKWFSENPHGVVVLTQRDPPPPSLKPLFLQPYRGRYLSIWGQGSIVNAGDYLE